MRWIVNPMPAVSKDALPNRSADSLHRRLRSRPILSREKNNAALSQMIEPAQERVFRLALRITRNKEDAQDAQQEALLKGYRKLDQFEGRSQFTTWISRIAINEALMCLRKRRHCHLSMEEAQPMGEGVPGYDYRCPIESPEAAYSRKELRDLLTRSIGNLRPSNRSVFIMRAVKCLSTFATAGALQISTGAVKGRMRRACSELRKQVQDSLARPRVNAHSSGRNGGTASRTQAPLW
jgi:RNA polymerase sigma-70 factor (ECF subfamily)